MDRELATDEPAQILGDEVITGRARAPHGTCRRHLHDSESDVPEPHLQGSHRPQFPINDGRVGNPEAADREVGDVRIAASSHVCLSTS